MVMRRNSREAERPKRVFEPEARRIAREVLPHDADPSTFESAREQLSALRDDPSMTPDARQVIGMAMTDLAIREGRAEDFRKNPPHHYDY